LQRLLDWLRAREQKLSDAAVARVLLALFGAVQHASHCAATPATRALVNQVVAAEDVFVTCKGDVKLLGFKPASRPSAGNAADPSEEGPGATPPEARQAAVDALLSGQRSPELGALLARMKARLSPSSTVGLWQVSRALQAWQEESLGSDGRAELAAVMAKLLPDGRATRRAHLVTACARVRRLQVARETALAADAEGGDEAAPVSGFRMAGGGASSQRAPESEAPVMPPPLPRLVEAPRATQVEVEAVEGEATFEGEALLEGEVLEGEAVEVEAVEVEASPLPLEPELAAPVEAVLGGRDPASHSTGSHRPLAIDVPANDAPGSRLPLFAAAMVFGAAAAFVAHHALRPPAASALGAPAATERLPPISQAAELAESASQPLDVPVSVTELVPGPAGLRSTAGRWTLPAGDRRPGTERAGTTSTMPVMARGYLTIDTTPRSSVSLGGVVLGQTPLVKLELPAGQHVLQLSNPEYGISSSAVVDIVAGVTMVRRIGLQPPPPAAP
ncbi:MAG TPA: PEGA domain-containing protein, partial [Polyangiaceae bacterium]|nr:PEGA domain-containing protein [Polyangiaceae bacterium]